MKIKLLLGLSFLVILSACKKEDPVITPPDSYIQMTSIPGCTNLETIELMDMGLSSVEDFSKWNDLYFFATSDRLFVKKDAIDGSTIIDEPMGIKKFLDNGNDMMICANEGIFKVNQIGELINLTNLNCTAITLTDDGSILFTSIGINYRRILKLEEDNSITHYTDDHNSETNCLPIHDIIIGENNNIFTSACDGFIIHYKDGLFTNSFSYSDMGFPSEPAYGSFFAAAFEDDLVVVAKNGIGYYNIIKYTAEGVWVPLFSSRSGERDTEKDFYMASPSITDILIYNDLLYISTTFASCRGVHYFDISKNTELSDDDYGIIQDPGLPLQCLEKLILLPDGNLYILSGNSQLTRLSCE